MWRTQFQKSRRASNTCDEFCCYHALDARVVCGRPVGRRGAASHAGMLARSPQIAAGESSRPQKPWARKLLASMRVTSNAGDDVGQSDVPARCYVARWPFAEVAACFDCAVAVDGSLETHVHPRRDRREPCAPKAEFVSVWLAGVAVRSPSGAAISA